MRLVLEDNDGKEIDAIDNVDVIPLGLEIVNAQGGVSMSAELRTAISRMLYEAGAIQKPAPAKKQTSGNVVSFPGTDRSG